MAAAAIPPPPLSAYTMPQQCCSPSYHNLAAAAPAYVSSFTPQVGCNFEDARSFVVVVRCPPPTRADVVRNWVLCALYQSTHVAAFDTYNRTQSAWRVRTTRESPEEVRVLIYLTWEGRRFLDMDALTFVRSTPRKPPAMNAAEVLWLMLSSVEMAPSFSSIGVSGVPSRIMDELWDDVRPGEKETFKLDSDWKWTPTSKP